MIRPACRNNRGSDRSFAVSEIIGAVLMISLVVTAVAIVAVFLQSQSTPESIPNVNFMVGTNAAGNQLYLYHNGGDTLKSGTFAVVLDGTTQRTDYQISDGSTNWSIGRNLILGISSVPKTVGIVYTPGQSGSILLRSSSSDVAALRSNIMPDATPIVPSAGSGGGGGGSTPAGETTITNNVSSIVNSSYFIEAIKENVSVNRINFFKNSFTNSGGLALGTQLSFKVDPSNHDSVIVYVKSGTTYRIPLNQTEIVRIKVISNTANLKIFGIAPQIWEMAVENVDLTIVRTNATTISESNIDITHTWIDSYTFDSANSNLRIIADGNSVTALTVNKTVYLPPPNTDASTFTFYNTRPLPVGLFLLIVDNSAKTVYFVGSADTICWGSNCGPFGL